MSEETPNQVMQPNESIAPPQFPFAPAAESTPTSTGNDIAQTPDNSLKADTAPVPAPASEVPLQPVQNAEPFVDAGNVEGMVNESVPSKKKRRKKQAPPKHIDGIEKASPSVTLKPKMGATENAVIAIGKLNRITTPYRDPKVITIDPVETKIEGSDIYFATDSDDVVNLYISDTGSNASASLQLIPRDLDYPVAIRIEQDNPGQAGQNSEPTGNSPPYHQDEPYLSEVKNIMRTLAKRMVPQGYTMGAIETSGLPPTICHNPSFVFTPGQVMSGHDSRIIILAAQNNSSTVQMFEEAFCVTEGVMSVAAWPRVRLYPGEKTEVYVLMKSTESIGEEQSRPSLF